MLTELASLNFTENTTLATTPHSTIYTGTKSSFTGSGWVSDSAKEKEEDDDNECLSENPTLGFEGEGGDGDCWATGGEDNQECGTRLRRNCLSREDNDMDFSYLYDPSNETAGAFVPAQILYDAFHGRYKNSTGAIILLFIIWGSFFFGGLSITTSAARVVYALSRDKGIPFSSIWRQIHPKHKVPSNAVWLCAAICIILGLPILKVNVVFTAITSICTIGWVGGYAVPIFARRVMAEKNFKAGPFYLGKASRPICLIAFLWICYTCCVFLLPTLYPISWDTFNYTPVALGVGLGLIMLWWLLDARKWFKGPVRNIDNGNGKVLVFQIEHSLHITKYFKAKIRCKNKSIYAYIPKFANSIF
ncbi:hypothetical protein LWI29_004763 [Acer saccharum]|uniref:Amino acid permease/ SLC12A domain-containing protein n=1 Tax=Acer saccharum TaxID=4024 RepID=A0AA39RQ50_ACESA|nr:hypothetical protein LWI29_004763 [Acer saccharum]